MFDQNRRPVMGYQDTYPLDEFLAEIARRARIRAFYTPCYRLLIERGRLLEPVKLALEKCYRLIYWSVRSGAGTQEECPVFGPPQASDSPVPKAFADAGDETERTNAIAQIRLMLRACGTPLRSLRWRCDKA